MALYSIASSARASNVDDTVGPIALRSAWERVGRHLSPSQFLGKMIIVWRHGSTFRERSHPTVSEMIGVKTITALAANKLGKFLARDFRRVFGPAHDVMAERLGKADMPCCAPLAARL
jgi:hypothetical protein